MPAAVHRGELMDELNSNLPVNSSGDASAGQPETDANSSRRDFLHGSARKLAYAAPLILLFHPKPACASNGSTLTYWDPIDGEIKHR